MNDISCFIYYWCTLLYYKYKRDQYLCSYIHHLVRKTKEYVCITLFFCKQYNSNNYTTVQYICSLEV